MAVTKEIVLQAIDKLNANNVEITTLNVHKITGGSLTTVSKYLKEIEHEQAQREITPNFLRKQIITLADELYSTISKSFNSEKQALEQAQEQFKQEQERQKEKLNVLETENSNLKKISQDLSIKLETTKSLMSEQRNDFLIELAKKDTDINTLKQDLEQLKKLLEQERKDFKDVLEQKNTEIKNLKSENDNLNFEIEKFLKA